LIDWNSLGSVSILSVEDDGFNQELASAIFEEMENVEVFRAENGKEAIDILQEISVDVILLDLIMPKMDGFETLKILKADKNLQSIPVIVVTSKEEEKKTTYKLGADDFISKPYSPEELKLRTFSHLKMKKFSDILLDIKEYSNGDDAGSEKNFSELKEILEMVDSSQKQLLFKLGNLSHENGIKDENSSKRLGEYAKYLSKLQGLNSKDIENIYYSMSIYDIGYLRIPKDVLSNNYYEEIQKHPILGIEILKDLKETALIKMAKEITYMHHEDWNGDGYPQGLRGGEISIYAQIASIVDYFDELTSKRSYNQSILSSQEAFEIIKRERGGKFNPQLLDMFINNFDNFIAIKKKYS